MRNNLHIAVVSLLLKCLLPILLANQAITGQSKIAINGAIIHITNGASIVLTDPTPNAITRTTGHIISEGETNKIVWNLGTTIGTYIIPFGMGATEYLPVSFTKSPGTGNGTFEFSTYPTVTWLNSSYLPSIVGHLNTSVGADNSSKVIDRFWQINAVNYSIKPNLSDITFTYLDAEYLVAANTITETNLQAQRWNSTDNSWGDFAPTGTVNTSANTVFVTSIMSADLYEWWTLVDNSSPLPVAFEKFELTCNENAVLIEWGTASEINNEIFSIEKSSDGENWKIINEISGAGNSTQYNYYSFLDKEAFAEGTYYRIRQTDFNGKFSNSKTLVTKCNPSDAFNVNAYPNPSSGVFTIEKSLSDNVSETITYEIINMYGEIIERSSQTESTKVIDISMQPKGVYLLRVRQNKEKCTFLKLIIQ